MKKWNDENTGKDRRGLFTRFLNPLYRTLGKRPTLHNGFLGSIQNQFEIAEDDVKDAKKDLYLDTAREDFLDYWGLKIGIQRRAGEDDETYRERIKKYIVVLRNTKPAIIDALKDYLGDESAHVTIYEPYTNIFYLNKSLLNGVDKLQGNYYRYAVIDVTIDRPFNYDEVRDILNKFKANGVIVYLTYNPSANSGEPVTSGLYDEFKVIATQLEARYLTALKEARNQELNLATTTLSKKRENVFKTNRSDLNGEDVLAGGFSSNERVSTHGIFYGDDEYLPDYNHVPTDMVIAGNNEELPPSAYTATSIPNGATYDATLVKGRALHTAYDLVDFYKMNATHAYKDIEMQYLRFNFDNLAKGLDFWNLVVETPDGTIVSDSSIIYVTNDKGTGYDAYPNGLRIQIPEARQVTMFVKLDKPYRIKSVAVNTTQGVNHGSIQVSPDNSTFYNLVYGDIASLYQYEFQDILSTSQTNYAEFLSGAISDLQALVGYRDITSIEVIYEIYNFYTKQWDELGRTVARYKTTFLSTKIPYILNYLNSAGTLVTRMRTEATTSTILEINHLALDLTVRAITNYDIDFTMSLMGSEISNYNDLSTLNTTVEQSKPLGEVQCYPFRAFKIIADPVEDDFNEFTLTEEQESNSPLGFDSGKFALENSTGETNGLVTITDYQDNVQTPVGINIIGNTYTLDTTSYITEIHLIQITLSEHVFVDVKVLDYKTGKWITPEFTKGSQSLTLTFPKGFSYANPFGNGTDPSLMPTDFFTTSKVTKELLTT